MQRQPVESTNIVSIGFDKALKTIEIEFKGRGDVWQYTGEAAEKHYLGIMAAESKGKYFNANIRKDTTLTHKKVSDGA